MQKIFVIPYPINTVNLTNFAVILSIVNQTLIVTTQINQSISKIINGHEHFSNGILTKKCLYFKFKKDNKINKNIKLKIKINYIKNFRMEIFLAYSNIKLR